MRKGPALGGDSFSRLKGEGGAGERGAGRRLLGARRGQGDIFGKRDANFCVRQYQLAGDWGGEGGGRGGHPEACGEGLSQVAEGEEEDVLIDTPGCNVVVLVLVLGSVAAVAAGAVVVVVVVVVEVVVSTVLVGERGEISSQSPGLGTTFSQSFDVYGGGRSGGGGGGSAAGSSASDV